MAVRLPPLSSLRAFEVAARHMSFRKAAAELHVTPAAVSHQVKTLEDYLGVTLFRRANRRVELTPAAVAAVPKLSEGFRALVEAVEVLRASDQGPVLTVSAAPSFAAKWLMPRLHRFVGRHPEIDVRLLAHLRAPGTPRRDRSTRTSANDGSLGDADVAIRMGDAQYPGLRVDRLLDLTVAPMASPALAGGNRPLRTPADLSQHALLHDDTGYFSNGRLNWDNWLAAAHVAGIDTRRGVHFSHANLAIDAAVDGLGVLVSAPALAAQDLASGRLVLPFELRAPADFGYDLVSSPADAERPAIQAFREWLLEEARTREPVPME